MLSGAGEIVSEYPISLDEWTTISAERNRNDGSLIVNDAPAVKGPTTHHRLCIAFNPVPQQPPPVAYPGFCLLEGEDINLNQIIYLPGLEFVALAILSISVTMHGNFEDLNSFIPPWVCP